MTSTLFEALGTCCRETSTNRKRTERQEEAISSHCTRLECCRGLLRIPRQIESDRIQLRTQLLNATTFNTSTADSVLVICKI